MKKISTFLLFLLQLASGAPQGQDCAPIEQLGTASLAQFDYDISIKVDDDDEYTLTIDFKHDEDLPAASNPPLQCDPSIVPPDLADDGLPYFAFRWFYQSVPEKVKKITGIDHISIDYNACGHPPANVFTAQHYDVHIYRITPEFRTCMTCTTVPGAPFCDPAPGAQTTDSGNGKSEKSRDSFECIFVLCHFYPLSATNIFIYANCILFDLSIFPTQLSLIGRRYLEAHNQEICLRASRLT